jgi:hypothetical protein
MEKRLVLLHEAPTQPTEQFQKPPHNIKQQEEPSAQQIIRNTTLLRCCDTQVTKVK